MLNIEKDLNLRAVRTPKQKLNKGVPQRKVKRREKRGITQDKGRKMIFSTEDLKRQFSTVRYIDIATERIIAS